MFSSVRFAFGLLRLSALAIALKTSVCRTSLENCLLMISKTRECQFNSRKLFAKQKFTKKIMKTLIFILAILQSFWTIIVFGRHYQGDSRNSKEFSVLFTIIAWGAYLHIN